MAARASHVAATRAVPRQRSAAGYGYAAAAAVIAAGWLANSRSPLVDTSACLGYWLGVAGASAMAVLLLYPARKKLRFMRKLGPTRHWFRLHMTLGVIGPVLILYHANFALGSPNSNVALFCTLLVAASGLVGRYLHSRIHADLDGHRRTLRELADKARVTAEERTRAAALAPGLLERLAAIDNAALETPPSFVKSLLLPLKLAVVTRWEMLRLRRLIRAALRSRARQSAAVAAERRRLQRTLTRFAAEHLKRVRRVAELHSYERLFGLWHLFHLPFFYMLVLTAVLHVVAVHMY